MASSLMPRLCLGVLVTLHLLPVLVNSKDDLDLDDDSEEEGHPMGDHPGAIDLDSYPTPTEDPAPGDSMGIEEVFGDIQLDAGQMTKLFKKMDKDGDGKVSSDDFLAYAKHMQVEIAKADMPAIMEEIDEDKDNKLTLDEILVELKNSPQKDEQGNDVPMSEETETAKFNYADRNQDGALDIHELPFYFTPEIHPEIQEDMSKESMMGMDHNEDGKLTQEELFPPEQAAQMDMGSVDLNHVFEMHDEDKDGFVDLKELMIFESGWGKTKHSLNEVFTKADANDDGHITAKELGKSIDKWLSRDSEGAFQIQQWVTHHEL